MPQLDLSRELRAARRAYGLHVRDLDDGTAQQPQELLQVGPSRPTFFARVSTKLFDKIPTSWRAHSAAVLAFVLGVAVGGGAGLWWWQSRPAPPPARVDEHKVELVLFEAVPPQTAPGGRGFETSALYVDGAVLLSGVVTSTVLTVGALHGLDVRAPALPAKVSPTSRFQPVTLEIVVRDCAAATRWAPDDRPFTISWRDEYGKVHLDRAGDFDSSMSDLLSQYVDAACDEPLDR
jgi:hypothetical protein